MAVVGQPEELVLGREPQVGPLQREDDRVYDRVGGDRDHHDRRGRDEHEREFALGAGPLGQGVAMRRRGGGGSGGGDGAHSSAVDESASFSSPRRVLTTLFVWMFAVGESAFWIASVTSAYAGVCGRMP